MTDANQEQFYNTILKTYRGLVPQPTPLPVSDILIITGGAFAALALVTAIFAIFMVKKSSQLHNRVHGESAYLLEAALYAENNPKSELPTHLRHMKILKV
jgi:hypothetical protein